VPEIVPDAPVVVAGPLALRHARARWGSFAVSINGKPFATGHDRPLIGYLAPAGASPPVRWLDFARGATVATSASPKDGPIAVEAKFSDPDGGRWTLR